MPTIAAILKRDGDALLAELGFTNISESERPAFVGQFADHFRNVLVETAIANMTEHQAMRFQEIIDEPDEEVMMRKLEDLFSYIPGLADLLREALEHEVEILRAARGLLFPSS